MMRRIVSPGLPSWPTLTADSDNQNAKVSGRFPTWRSHERGLWATEVVIFLSYFVIAWIAWEIVPPYGDIVFHIFACVIVWGIIFTISSKLFREALPSFFARTIFAASATLYFIPGRIGIKSRLFPNGLSLPRDWNSKPIGIRFLMEQDGEALIYSADQSPTRNTPRAHVNNSNVLTIHTHVPPPVSMTSFDANALCRAIPISEMSLETAMKFVVVCNAALMLTARTVSIRPQHQIGRDIDKPFLSGGEV